MAFGDFKGLPRGTTSHKVLRYKMFNTAKNSNMMDINVVFFDKKTSNTNKGRGINSDVVSEKLLEKLINEKYTHLLLLWVIDTYS